MKKNLLQSIMTIIIFGIFTFTHSFAQINEENVKKELPKLLNTGYAGNMFYVTFFPGITFPDAPDKVIIYVTSQFVTNVNISVGSKDFNIVKTIYPNKITAIEIPIEIATAYTKYEINKPEPTNVYRNSAIKISSDSPIICYVLSKFHFQSEGFMAMPSHTLGMEYVVSASPDIISGGTRNQWLTSYTALIGIYDNTRVDFRLGGNDSSWVPRNGYDRKDALNPGQTMREYVDAGDVWLVPVMGYNGNATGSYWRANKPVAVVSGSSFAYIPSSIAKGNYIIDQQKPIESWGTEYHVVPYALRKKNSFVAVFAKEDATTIYRDGEPWFTINRGKGGIEGGGYKFARISNTNDEVKAYTISSDPDKPIYVVQYNTGGDDDNVNSYPFMMALNSTMDYSKDISFVTPKGGTDYNYNNQYVNLIYLADKNGKIPDDLEITRVDLEELNWQKVKNISDAPEFPVWTEEREDGRKYYAKQIQLSDEGIYRIRAFDAFGAYLYGNTTFTSYGFSVTGAATSEYEDEDTMPPVIEYEYNCWGKMEGTIRDTADTENYEVISNLGLVYLVNSESYNFLFEFDEITSGITKEAKFSLEVQTNCQPAAARMMIIDRRGNTLDTTITYEPKKFIIEPEEFDFITIKPTNGTQRQEFTITLNSDHCGMAINKFFFRTSERDYPASQYKPEHADDQSHFKFDFSELRIDEYFEPNETRRFWVEFTPEEEGEFSDEIGVGNTFNCYRHLAKVSVKVDKELSVSDKAEPNLLFISPNPTNGNTVNIEFSINQGGEVQLNMYNSRGDLVSEIYSATLPYGDYIRTIETSNFPAGTYIIELLSGESRVTEKLVIIK